ncbi:MAG: PadR family transcriptional regulator [Geodermatophilaceae bacterium]|nr:PadR family transcriptional regulator [Geodermatophilaceae bacterium]
MLTGRRPALTLRTYAAYLILARVAVVAGGLNSTSAALLGLLHDGPLTGGQLVAQADERLGPLWTLTRSQVYRELPVLAGRGYLRAGKPGPRASLAYTISAAGKRAFAEWLASPLETDHPRNPLLLRLGFGSYHSRAELRRLIAEAREQHEASLAVHKGTAGHLKRTKGNAYALAAADFGVAYEKALLKWLDSIPT